MKIPYLVQFHGQDPPLSLRQETSGRLKGPYSTPVQQRQTRTKMRPAAVGSSGRDARCWWASATASAARSSRPGRRPSHPPLPPRRPFPRRLTETWKIYLQLMNFTSLCLENKF